MEINDKPKVTELTRILALVIDQENRFYLPLMTAQPQEIDAWTSQFHSSDDIRSFFATQIEEYLAKYQSFLANSKYKNGRIVILQPQVNNETEYNNIDIMVLYKKHIHAIRTILSCEPAVRAAEQQDYDRAKRWQITRLFPDELAHLIHFTTTYTYRKYNVSKRVEKWLSESKKKQPQVYYEKVRLLAEGYKDARKMDLDLKTFDRIEKEYQLRVKNIQEKRAATLLQKKLALQEATFSERTIHLHTSDDTLNSCRTPEDIFAIFDLDELARIPEARNLFDGLREESSYPKPYQLKR